MKLFLLLITVAVLWGGVCSVNNRLADTQSDMVFAVCNQSRVSDDISEAECGRLQDKWHREFLCDAGNRDADNHCWVEVK